MENEEMKRIVVERDGGRNIVFVGKIVAEESTRENNSTRWRECAVYETKGGKYVLSDDGISLWQGESDVHDAKVFGTLDDLFRDLTVGNEIDFVTKSLAKQLGYDLTEEIE